MAYTRIDSKRHNVQHEGEEQAALFQWAYLQRNTYPELDLLFHIPNGGQRNAAEAANAYYSISAHILLNVPSVRINITNTLTFLMNGIEKGDKTMTPEEAIRKLCVYSSTNGSGQCTSAEHLEAKKIALKAIERQMPKKQNTRTVYGAYALIVVGACATIRNTLLIKKCHIASIADRQ